MCDDVHLNNPGKASNGAFGGPIILMRREGQSPTFCRFARQIYRTLFVSNSRNQQVATNLFQVTAYAFTTITSAEMFI